MSDCADYLKGITHCRPHGNKMPCEKCGKNLAENLKMSENKITSDDIEATYKVLEHLREKENEIRQDSNIYINPYGEEAVLNDAHYLVQLFEEQQA